MTDQTRPFQLKADQLSYLYDVAYLNGQSVNLKLTNELLVSILHASESPTQQAVNSQLQLVISMFIKTIQHYQVFAFKVITLYGGPQKKKI